MHYLTNLAFEKVLFSASKRSRKKIICSSPTTKALTPPLLEPNGHRNMGGGVNMTILFLFVETIEKVHFIGKLSIYRVVYGLGLIPLDVD